MSDLPRGGFGSSERPGRRRAFALGALAIVLVIGWSYGVLSYGRDEATEGAAGGGNRAARPAPPSGAAREEPQAVPDEKAHATAPPEQRQPPARSSETPAEARAPQDSPGRTPDRPEGNAGGPGFYDPLGTGASAGALAPIDRERVRFAAARFVSAAYGYSGRDEDAYNQGVGATVVWPAFYESPGAAEIERYAAQVGKTGTESAALLTRFDVEKTTPDTAEGYARFETSSGYGPEGELAGEKLAYRQRMVLARSGSVWKVRATEKVEETR